MELETLRQQWQQLDRKLDRSLALEAELARELVLRPARRRVNRLAVWPSIEIVASAAALFLGGGVLADFGRDWRAAAPAVVVMLAAVALLHGSIRQLLRLSDLDWTGPVADIQAALGRIRLAKVRQFKWAILFGPLVAFCGVVVAFILLTRGHPAALDKLDSPWVLSNYAFGVLFVPLGYLAAGVLARRCDRHPWWQSVLDDVSGTTLKSAAHDVERWARLTRNTTSA